MVKKDEILKVLSLNLRKVMDESSIDFEYLQEVRLRVNKPLIVIYKNREYFISKQHKFTSTREDAYIVSQNELRETMEYISNYSLYAFEDEIRQGFITIQGGHRVGVAGKAIIDGEHVKNFFYQYQAFSSSQGMCGSYPALHTRRRKVMSHLDNLTTRRRKNYSAKRYH